MKLRIAVVMMTVLLSAACSRSVEIAGWQVDCEPLYSGSSARVCVASLGGTSNFALGVHAQTQRSPSLSVIVSWYGMPTEPTVTFTRLDTQGSIERSTEPFVLSRSTCTGRNGDPGDDARACVLFFNVSQGTMADMIQKGGSLTITVKIGDRITSLQREVYLADLKPVLAYMERKTALGQLGASQASD